MLTLQLRVTDSALFGAPLEYDPRVSVYGTWPGEARIARSTPRFEVPGIAHDIKIPLPPGMNPKIKHNVALPRSFMLGISPLVDHP